LPIATGGMVARSASTERGGVALARKEFTQLKARVTVELAKKVKIQAIKEDLSYSDLIEKALERYLAAVEGAEKGDDGK